MAFSRKVDGSFVMTKWTEARLNRLYSLYNEKYWDGSLSRFEVKIGKPSQSAVGLCDLDARTIVLDLRAHRTDSEIRGTLLHEMADVAAGHGGFVHGRRFWKQIEHLLRRHAPITLTMSEAPTHRLLAPAIPRQFRMARSAAQKHDAAVKKHWAQIPVSGAIDVDDEYICVSLIDAAPYTTWKKAVLLVGGELGIVDVDGNPTSKWSANSLRKAKRRFQAARTRFLSGRRLAAATWGSSE